MNRVADRSLIRRLKVLCRGVNVVLLKGVFTVLDPRCVMTARMLVNRPGFTIVTWRPG